MPPAVHGISGNYFYDRAAGQEVMMNDARFLRAPTIMAAFHDAGARVAVVTAKDKLRTLLGNGLDMRVRPGDRVFLREGRPASTLAENGIAEVLDVVGMTLPDVYSAELSEFVFAAGVQLLRARPAGPDVSFDHRLRAAQGGAGLGDGQRFYAMIDRYVGALDEAGAVLALTADHGMNDKHRADGSPDVIYLQDWFDQRLGAGAARVILPITDPYVLHHGALGSFATVYLPEGADRAALAGRAAADRRHHPRPRIARRPAEQFELPPDRTGDIVVISTRDKVLGTSAARHDLSGLTEPLRSHGGVTEQEVPMIVNRHVSVPAGTVLRNFDVFDVALNLVDQGGR